MFERTLPHREGQFSQPRCFDCSSARRKCLSYSIVVFAVVCVSLRVILELRLKREVFDDVHVPPVRQRLIVTGTGRGGTSFLMLLFSRLGLPTGFNASLLDQSPSISRLYDDLGGLEAHGEFAIEKKVWPRDEISIVKSPKFALPDNLRLARQLNATRLIICVRDIERASASRVKRFAQKKSAGGLWGVTDPNKQLNFLLKVQADLLYTAVDLELDLVFLAFPKLTDEEYLWRHLQWLWVEYRISRSSFSTIFQATSKKEWISTETKSPFGSSVKRKSPKRAHPSKKPQTAIIQGGAKVKKRG